MRSSLLQVFFGASILFSAHVSAQAETLRITRSQDWEQWRLPGDAMEIVQGTLGPTLVRRDINPVGNAAECQYRLQVLHSGYFIDKKGAASPCFCCRHPVFRWHATDSIGNPAIDQP
mgnify:CR=1 FL=1